MNSITTLVQQFRQEGPVILLDSQSKDHPSSQKSYVAAVPDARIEAYGNRISIHHPSGQTEHFEENPWKAFKAFRKDYPGFHFGWFAYDLKNHSEQLNSDNPDPVSLPDLFFFRPTRLFEMDMLTGRVSSLAGAAQETVAEKEPGPAEQSALQSGDLEADYMDKIREAKRRITEGEFYEINLSHQLTGRFRGDAFGLYQRMKQNGPVPFGAFIQRDNISVCCVSPERFLRKEGPLLTSEPIKGTVRRGNTEAEDIALKRFVQDSEKNRAENLMIVDLVRNDLSRVARPGSVRVEKLFDIQTFSTLHQMVSTVTAQADKEADPVEIIRACFPMGSMTGAPKIRAMQSIEELESYRRGLYSGAIGYFTPEGDFDFNVVIRTAIVKDSGLYYSIGGAVTGDSDPREEWEETWIKARAITDVMNKKKQEA